MLKRASAVGLAVLLLQAWFVGFGYAVEKQVVMPGEEARVERPSYAPGRIIVKLTPKAAGQVDPVQGMAKTIAAQKLPVEPLRVLSQKFQVVRWERLFPVTGTKEATGLERVYLLLCDKEVDVQAAARAFGGLKDLVEYAEPDYQAHIQNGR